MPSSLRSAEPRIGAQFFGQPFLGARRNEHAPRIDDAIASEGIDLEPQLIGRQHLLALHIDRQHALVDPDDLFGKGDAGDQPGARLAEIFLRLVTVHDADRFTKSDDHRLPGFGNDGERAADQDDQHDRRDRQRDRIARDHVHHWPSPAGAGAGAVEPSARRLSSGKGR